MRRYGWPAVVAGAALLASAASAQSPSNSGQGPNETSSPNVSVEERGTLPAAGGGAGSAAPGAKIDCTKNPQDCSEPVNRAGSGTTPADQVLEDPLQPALGLTQLAHVPERLQAAQGTR